MMGWQGHPKTKKVLRETAVGKEPRFEETSLFGAEYKGDGSYPVVGPDPYTKRTWYATVVVKNGLVASVK